MTRAPLSEDRLQDLEAATASHDINFAAALRAQYAIDAPKFVRRQHRKPAVLEADEPLVDRTKILPLHSKKTERLQKRQQKRSERAAARPVDLSLLDLPNELLSQVLGFLQPSDIFRLSRVSHPLKDFINEHENTIAREIIRRRFFILYRCFPLPVALCDVPEDLHSNLLNERRQEMLNIHRKSYHQHIEMVDPYAVCTCMTCVFAWNNLCLIVDLHHWQRNLDQREPIPMIPRGTYPQWNKDLLRKNADNVRMAMTRPLYYACILEKHLATITQTILRFARWKKKGAAVKPRLYHMTDADAASGTDMFLERSGPPSYDFPFHRDNYYTVEAYLPNRKFGVDGKWHYYALSPTQHEKDLEWVKTTFGSGVSREARSKQALLNSQGEAIK